MSNASVSRLETDLRDRRATVAVVGLGYVGLPLLACLHAAGHRVIGFDIDPTKPIALHRGENYLPHLGLGLCKPFATSTRFLATTDPAALAKADAIIICVPTPLTATHEPDLHYVHATGEMLGRVGARGKLIVLESTSYPGTTRDELWPSILKGHAAAGHTGTLTLGTDALLAFSPEREDPGRKDFTTKTIPKLVGGTDELSTRAAVALYQGAIDTVIPVSSAEVAEAAKVFENVFRAVNIALVNELKCILEPMKIDVWEVIAAAKTKPFGFMPFSPGPGLGGHCIPIDPYYLSWKAKQHGQDARLIELAGIINTAMPARVVDRTIAALRDRNVAVPGARVLVLGLAYKPDVSDVRESPSFEIIERLESLGCEVRYSDPYVPATWAMRKHDLEMTSTPLDAQSLAWADAVLVSTAHTTVDWELVARHARLVIDTRNALRPWATLMGDRLVRA